jgi:membrane associated rhomboid family serine protease
VEPATTEGGDGESPIELPSLLDIIQHRVTRGDGALLLTVPLLLTLVFALPMSVKREYALAYDDPTLVTAYASHFVHLNLGHLLVNVGGYLLVVPTAYVLSLAADRRRQFLVVFTAFVVAFPLALSALNLLFARPRLGVGFSGIVMAFVGYLPVAIIGAARRRLYVPIDRLRSQWLFFFGLAIIALFSGPALLGGAIAAAAALAGVLFVLPVVEEWDATHHHHIQHALGRAGNVELLLVGILVFVGYLFVAFPGNTTGEGTVVNVYSHVLGFSLGYVTTYVTMLSGGLNVD